MKYWWILLLSLFLMGCTKHQGTGLDWTTRPHQDTIPRPVGKWNTTPIVAFHTDQIYGTANTLGWALKDADTSMRKAALDQNNWCKGIGYKWDVMSPGNVDVYFYYAPGSKTTSDVNQFEDVVIVQEGKTTSGIQPPTPDTNYSGLTVLGMNGEVINHATVWLNVRRYQAYYDLFKTTYPAATDEQLKAWSLNRSNMGIDIITWHEFGHAIFGLADDRNGKLPGTMVYNNMVKPYSQDETDVIKWMYGGKK